MIRRELDDLRSLLRMARKLGQAIEYRRHNEPRLSLSMGEASRHASLTEEHLRDAVETAEAELYRGRSKTKE